MLADTLSCSPAMGTLDGLKALLATEGRVALLSALKGAGVARLGDRQRLANEVTRAQRGAVSAREVPRPYPSWLVRGPVPRVRWDDPKLRRFLRLAEPPHGEQYDSFKLTVHTARGSKLSRDALLLHCI